MTISSVTVTQTPALVTLLVDLTQPEPRFRCSPSVWLTTLLDTVSSSVLLHNTPDGWEGRLSAGGL